MIIFLINCLSSCLYVITKEDNSILCCYWEKLLLLGVLIQPSHPKLCHCSAAGSVYLLIYGRVFRADSNCERKPFLFSVSNKLFQITFNTLVYRKPCKSLVWPKLRFLKEESNPKTIKTFWTVWGKRATLRSNNTFPRNIAKYIYFVYIEKKSAHQ